MSVPDWPSSLPQKVLQDSYSETLTNNTIRTAMDTGPAKVRRRNTAVVEPIKSSILCTQAQWVTIRYFYYTTLGSALPFSWVHPSTGATVNLRFVTPPAIASPRGQNVVVALDLEVIP